jgi:hypothetical protein
VANRLTTVVTVSGLDGGAARASAPVLLGLLRQAPRVASADAEWDAPRGVLRVIVEAHVDGDVTDMDEATNFDRVWRSAIAAFADDARRLRFDIDGSI